jgi:AcrR family transcriptional regulator
VVAAARELFYRQGYRATTLVEVATLAGVHGGSIYHFFPTKERLVEAVLESYLQLLEPAIMAPVRFATPDARQRVGRLLDGYRTNLLATDFRRGCPIGMLALEVGESQPRARRLAAANFEAWRDALAVMLREGRRPPRGDPAAIATFVLTVMEGAVMQAMTCRRIEPFDACAEHVDRYLSTLVEPGRRR